MLENQCTIVTAYFEFPIKKHTTNSYFEWISNFLPNVNSYMIIFTDINSYNKLLELRTNFLDKTEFIILNINEFYTAKFIDYWKKDYIRDHENGYHHPFLYMIWNEKSHFLKIAVNKNVFNTEYFMWCDIGILRDKNCIKYLSNFPNKYVISKLKKDKVYLLNIDEFNNNELNVITPTECFRFKNRIGGTVILGTYNILNIWIDKFYDMLNRFMLNDLFAGKDQSIMACVYLENKDLIELIKPTKSPFNEWFYLLYYLC